MSETILLVGHGSRDIDGNIEIERFADSLRKQQPALRIELCFIEFAKVLLDEGLQRAAVNSSKVIVLPLILNAAGHVKLEIPYHIRQAQLRNPHCEYVYAEHLGAGTEILAILKRRLMSAMQQLDVPDPANTSIILLGRGSSDRVANGEVAKMARWLQEGTRHELVDIAFTGITTPRLERVVQRHIALGAMQVIVLPYYLYTGTLIKRIDRQINALRQQYPQCRFALGHYFGFEPEIPQLLLQRIHECRHGHCMLAAYANEKGERHDHSHDHSHS